MRCFQSGAQVNPFICVGPIHGGPNPIRRSHLLFSSEFSPAHPLLLALSYGKEEPFLIFELQTLMPRGFSIFSSLFYQACAV
ncbi:hypothetical protein J5N97_028930 [Dioscorea zingiberensis]|uniref:Uncharacterized protein n=1 Tax=Dioscorea zingiberensis TaxID=325984 RepID=A0A9D5BZX6_9LILI|nr:hypothetical protein J5N97_028930 [Dioscorea zingiberensis]